jgi:hypothetical protein
MTWTDRYHLGAGPAEEGCAQVGSDGYEERATVECRAYIAAIQIVCGDPPPKARLLVEWANHDFGRYAEVVVAFDRNDREAAEYAARCDAQAPTTWAAAGLTAPAVGKRYFGRRAADGTVSVWVEPADGEPYSLPPRLDLRCHSPAGFNFGSSGSGAAQLALALAVDVLDDERARRVYQPLKKRVVAGVVGDSWELSEDDPRGAVTRIEREKGADWKLRPPLLGRCFPRPVRAHRRPPVCSSPYAPPYGVGFKRRHRHGGRYNAARPHPRRRCGR